VKGPKPSIEITMEQVSEKAYMVNCPKQTVTSVPVRKQHKAVFNPGVCKYRSLWTTCPTIKRKNDRVLYFTHKYYLALRRQKVIDSLPEERKKLRNNVEATVNEFVCRMPCRKLKVQGMFEASIFAFSVAIGVNFGRIFRLIQEDTTYSRSVFLYFANFVKDPNSFLRKFLVYYVFLRTKARIFLIISEFYSFQNP
jgi:hypothetical protein